MGLHYNANNSYLFVNGRQIFNLKDNNKNACIQTQFYLGSVSNGFSATDFTKKRLKRNISGVSVDNSSTDKSDTM